jgi:hypothetical protein
MNTILYTQNESPTKPSTILIDGEVYHDFYLENTSKAFKFIMDMASEKGRWRRVIKRLIKTNDIKSPNFKYVKNSEGILIQSNFMEKDEAGRYMPFTFFTRERNLLKANTILQQYATQLNRSLGQQELVTLAKEIREIKIIWIGLGSSIFFLSFIALWIISRK